MTECKMRRISPKLKDFINVIDLTFARTETRHGAGGFGMGRA
jgi:hypothetical protein